MSRPCTSLATGLISIYWLVQAVPVVGLTTPTVTDEPKPVDIQYGPDTTVFTQPRREDGTVNYIQAWNKKHQDSATPDKNGFVDIARVMPPTKWASLVIRQEVFDWLGVPLPDDDAGYFIDFDSFVRPHVPGDVQRTEIYDRICDRPWQGQQHPEAAAWIASNQMVFDAIAQACSRQEYWEPWVTNSADDGLVIDVQLSQLGFSRQMARLVKARVFKDIGEGNLQIAMDHVLLLLRYSRLVSGSKLLISNLVGVSISRMGHQLIVHMLTSPHFTSQQAKKLLAGLRQVPDLTPIAIALDQGERFCALDAVLQIARGRVSLTLKDDMTPQQAKALAACFDVNVAMREFNEAYDRMVEVSRSDDFATYQTNMAKLEVQIKNRRSFLRSLPVDLFRAIVEGPGPIKEHLTRQTTELLLNMLVPAIGASQHVQYRHQQQQALSFVVLAVTAYRLDHGDLPSDLAELVPEYLDQLPIDWFNKQPLRYKHNEKGFVVYSIGSDLDDDGGRPRGMKDRDDPDDQADISVCVGQYPVPVGPD